WENQALSSELEQMLATWAPLVHAEIVQSAGSRNVTEWCKKDDCWTEMRSIKLPLPRVLPPEFTTASGLARSGVEVAEELGESDSLIERCMSCDAAAWARIVAWAVSSLKVDDFDRKVAHTLSGYAMNGWVKPPSLKQAVRGVRVIDAAREAGVAL